MKSRRLVSAFDLALIQKLIDYDGINSITHIEDYFVSKKTTQIERQDGKVKAVITYEYEEFDLPVKEEVVVIADADFFNIVSFRRI